MRITPIHICLSIVVDPYGGVDIIPVFGAPYQRFAQWVLEWTEGRVGYEHADAIAMNRAVHIPFAIALDDLFCPSSIVTFVPFEILERCHSTVVLPVDHIGGGIEQPVFHLESLSIVFIMSGVEIDGVAMYIGSRVGRIFGLDDRQVDCLRLLGRCSHYGCNHSDGGK